MKLEKFNYRTNILIPDHMEMETDTELTQYFIKSWELKYMVDGKRKSVHHILFMLF